MRSLIVLWLVNWCLVGQPAFSLEQTPAISESPVPYLNPDHSITVGQQGHRVFLDRSSGDAYVLFNPGDRELILIELNRHVDPEIKVDVSYSASTGTWNYSYTFSNSARARQPAVSWFFKDLTSQNCLVTVSDGWSYLFPNLMTTPPWPRLVVAASGGSKGIMPHSQVATVVLTSKLAPGLQDVYVQGSTTNVLAFPSEPDDVVFAELRKVIGFPYNYQRSKTLGPRLNTTIEGAPSVYQQELRQCETEGECSQTFSGLAAVFLTHIETHVQGKNTEIERLRSAAKSKLERDFANVLIILAERP